MLSIFTILLLVLISAVHSFNLLATRHIRSTELAAVHKESSSNADYFKKTAATLMIAASLVSVPPPAAQAAAPSTVLEEKLLQLEASGDRATAVQSLADLFEAAGSQTLKARTKYKYVLPSY